MIMLHSFLCRHWRKPKLPPSRAWQSWVVNFKHGAALLVQFSLCLFSYSLTGSCMCYWRCRKAGKWNAGISTQEESCSVSSIHRDSSIQEGGKHKGFAPETGTWFIDVFIHLGRKSTWFLLLVSPGALPRPPPVPPSAIGNFYLLLPISQAKPTPFRPHPCARGKGSFPGVGKKKKKDKKKKLWWLLALWGWQDFNHPILFCFLFKNVPLLARRAGREASGKGWAEPRQHWCLGQAVLPAAPRGLCGSLWWLHQPPASRTTKQCLKLRTYLETAGRAAHVEGTGEGRAVALLSLPPGLCPPPGCPYTMPSLRLLLHTTSAVISRVTRTGSRMKGQRTLLGGSCSARPEGAQFLKYCLCTATKNSSTSRLGQ